jgi:predicted Zn-dependent protease
VHTLALPMRPVKPARPLAYGLALACTTLLPLPSHAFTYDVLAGSVIVQHQSTGMPLVWPTSPIPLRLALGDAGRRLLNGTTSWDDNAAAALAEWTAVVPLLVQQSEAPNVVRWADPAAGEHLGSLAATTQKEYHIVNGRGTMVRATTLLNPALCWEAYEGPLRYTFCQGQLVALLDVRRIVLHELGHVLGLEHPDEGGQIVAAIMNQAVSDTDRLQADDEAGILALYPPQPASTQQAVRAPAAGGGQGGGCAMGQGDPEMLLPLVVVVLLGHGLRAYGQRRATRRRRLRESRRPGRQGPPRAADRAGTVCGT